MLSPKRTKYRRPHRGRMKGKATRGNTIAFGDFALQALEPCWLTARQIEAGRRAMTRYARMGSGKGDPDYWVAVIKPGKILYEMKGVSEPVARAAMRIASYKMPVKTQFLVRPETSETTVRPI